jgi:hypothetical protein
VAIAACLLLLAAESPARATPSSRLVYSRTADSAACPDEEALRQAVTKRFGYDPFFAWAKQTVSVQIWRSDGHYRSRILVIDERGVARGARELSSDSADCADLFGATALAVSIALDASARLAADSAAAPAPAAASSEQPASPPAPEVPSPQAAGMFSAPADAPAPGASPPDAGHARSAAHGAIHAFAGVDLLGSVGMQPSLAGGTAVYVGLRRSAFSAALEGQLDAPASVDVTATGGRVTSSIVAASLVPCFHVAFGSACLVGSLGEVRASGSGVADPASSTALMAAAGGRLGAEIPLSEGLFLRLHGDLLANLSPPTLRLNRAVADEWTAPYVAGVFGGGLLVRFP